RGKARQGWLDSAYCDACRKRHRAAKAEGRTPRAAAAGRPTECGRTAPPLSPPRRRRPVYQGKAPGSQGTTADSTRNQQLRPADFTALAADLDPLIGPWPEDADALDGALFEADLPDPEPDDDVQPLIRSGWAQVLEVPEYIS